MELAMDRPRRYIQFNVNLRGYLTGWLDNRRLRKQLNGLQADYAIMTDQCQMMKEHIQNLQEKIEDMTENSDRTSSVIDAETPYSVAILLAKKGCSRPDIIRECGLTESEADLILALHNRADIPESNTIAAN